MDLSHTDIVIVPLSKMPSSQSLSEPPVKKAKLSEETRPTNTVSPEDFEPQNIVTIIVGEKKQKFQMSKQALCRESEFFKAKCSGRWPTDDGVDLTDIPVHIFGIFLVWLSTGYITDSDGDILALDNYEIVHGSECTQLIHCYLLADRLLAQKFQNCIADEICFFLDADTRKLTEKTIFENVSLVYRSTLRDSALRCILQDATLRYIKSSNVATQVAENSQDGLFLAEFWKELAIGAMSWLENPSMVLQGDYNIYDSRFQCRYHRHGSEEEKRLCRRENTRMKKHLIANEELDCEFPTL